MTALPAEEYDVMGRIVDEAKLEQPSYSMGDLVRDFIQRGLGRTAPAARPLDVRSMRQRQLRAISRTALELAKQLEG